MKKKAITLAEMKRKNKSAGQFFFQRGNPPVLSKKGDTLITKGYGGGKVEYKYDRKTGKIMYIKHLK